MNIEEIEPIKINAQKEKKWDKSLHPLVPLLAAAVLWGIGGKYLSDYYNNAIKGKNDKIETLSTQNSELIDKITMLEANEYNPNTFYNVEYQTREDVNGKLQDTLMVRTCAVDMGQIVEDQARNYRFWEKRKDMKKGLAVIVPGIWKGYEKEDIDLEKSTGTYTTAASTAPVVRLGSWDKKNNHYPKKKVPLNENRVTSFRSYLRK